MSSLSAKIVGNTLAQVAGKAASVLLGVAITMILTRYLGVTGYGTYTFILVFTTMFNTLADWGLTLITVREASKNSQSASQVIGNVLVIRLVLSLAATLASVIAVNLLPYDSQTRLLTSIASLGLVALSLKTSFQIVFNVKFKMHYWAISEFSANFLTLVLLVLLVWSRASFLEIILAFLAGDFFAAGIAAGFGYKLLPLRYSLLTKTTKYLLFESLPMGALLALFTIYNRLDTVILSLFKGQEAVGYYGAAYRIFEVLTLGAAYFANAILPLISVLAVKDKARLGLVYRKCFVVLFFLGLCAAGGTFLLAPLFIQVLAPGFAGSVVALRILSLALIVSYFNHLSGFTIIALGKQWQSVKIAVIALISNLLLNIWLIPRFSYFAAAGITFVTEALIVILSVRVIAREIGVTPRLSDIPLVLKEVITKKGRIFEEPHDNLL